MRLTTIFAAVVAAAYPAYATTATETTSSTTTATTGIASPSAQPTLGVAISQGCFSSWGDLILTNTSVFTSRGSCATVNCTDAGYLVAAMSAGDECWCGNEYPPEDTKVADSKCSIGCAGYPQEACGGFSDNTKYFSVFNTGVSLDVSYAKDNVTSSTSSSGDVVASSTVVSGGQTSVVYVTSSATAAPQKSSNVGGIVAGVVVGVVVLLAIAGGVFFFMRRRKNREIEEEHRRNAAVNAFMKPPGSSGGYSIDTDVRMDPVMAQRRLSSGSIADNQDYSRRILRVTNA